MMKKQPPIHVFCLVLGALISSGCGKKNAFIAPPPPEVKVGAAHFEPTTVYQDFPGRVAASEHVEIRARVSGFLQSREFSAGQYVEAGKALFKIEPERFKSAVDAALAKVAKAEADLEIADTNFKKRKAAFDKSQAVSELDVLAAEADRKAAEAAAKIAQAAVADAKRDLSYTTVVTPISGRVSSARVDRGNLVGADGPTLLTTVSKTQPVYFYFEADERSLLPFLKNLPGAANPEIKPKNRAVELVLSDGSNYDEKGELDFVDNAVDVESGTIRLRARFANEKGVLIDGLFGHLRIPRTIENAVKIPKALVQRDLGGSFVLVVSGEENKVERRSVAPTGQSSGGDVIVEPYDAATRTGVNPDDRIVRSNLQRARPGIVVNPVDASAPPPPPPPPPANEDGGEPQAEKAEEAPEETSAVEEAAAPSN